jgi:plasmid stability protein
MMSERSLNIDSDLYERLAYRAESHGFESTEEYATTVLQTVLNELEKEAEDDQVAQRLKDLGYLD